jgi:predicted metal-dependent phosphoesterase TrpH
MKHARGIIHVHSTYSYDSETPLAEVAAMARRRRLAVVVQTEHSNEMTTASHALYRAEAARLSTDGVFIEPGVEYASADNAIHVLVLGIDAFWEDLARFQVERIGDLLNRVRDGGGLSILAHPERAHALDKLPPGVLHLFDGIEVWNGKTDRWAPSPRALEALASFVPTGRTAFATAGLDLHRLTDFVPVGLEFEGEPRTSRQLLDALEKRQFKIFFGPLRWDANRAGALARGGALASRWLLKRARFVKAKLKAALAFRTRPAS